jgi:voltage-gated potassium channel
VPHLPLSKGGVVRNRLAGWLTRPLTDRTLASYVLYRLRWALLALVILFCVATIGYVVIDNYSWLDAAFMTVITLSTVGFGEGRRLNAAGQLFTIGVIIVSFGTLVYAASTLTEMFTSGSALEHLRKVRGRRMRQAMGDHVIVVGFGRVGRAVAGAVKDLGYPCLVLERNAELETSIEEVGCVAMIGDATVEADLTEAGIQRAAGLVAAAEQDNVNLVVTLTARAVRQDLRIVSRVNEAAWRDRIIRAGANIAQSPYQSYGMSLAASAVNPAVIDVHGLPLLGLGTEEIAISDTSPFLGKSLGEVTSANSGVFIAGLRRESRLHRCWRW